MPDIHNSVYDSIQCILPLNTSGTMEPNNMNEEQYCIVSSPQKNQPKKRRTMGLRISSDSTMGGRKHQEDRILIAFDRKDDADYACLCVFDGHGGEHASVYARDHLWENIKKQTGFFSRDHEEVMKAIRQGFHFTQAEMWKVRRKWIVKRLVFTCSKVTPPRLHRLPLAYATTYSFNYVLKHVAILLLAGITFQRSEG